MPGPPPQEAEGRRCSDVGCHTGSDLDLGISRLAPRRAVPPLERRRRASGPVQPGLACGPASARLPSFFRQAPAVERDPCAGATCRRRRRSSTSSTPSRPRWPGATTEEGTQCEPVAVVPDPGDLDRPRTPPL